MSKARARSAFGLVGLLVLLAWGQAEAQLAPASAEVVRATGRVEVLAKGQPAWAAARVGTRLVEGDQVRALAGSSADLSLPDGSTILVAENSRFAVTKLEYDQQSRDRNASFYLVAGKVRAQVSHAAVQLARQRQSNFTISTPSGVAAVRGTIAVVAHNPATGETLIFALPSAGQTPAAARLTFVSRTPGQPSVTLTGGNFLRIQPGAVGTPQPISTLSPAGQAAITTPGNPATAGLPDLTGFTVTIIDSTTDITLVESATTGATAVAGPPPPGQIGGGPPPPGQIGPGPEVVNRPPGCTPSSSTTCP